MDFSGLQQFQGQNYSFSAASKGFNPLGTKPFLVHFSIFTFGNGNYVMEMEHHVFGMDSEDAKLT